MRIPPRSWLPALPDGTSMGPMPGSLHDRFVALYQTFTDAWRVTSATSLFDYAPGTSTDTFTMRGWPPEHPPCSIPGTIPVEPASEFVAQQACKLVTGESEHNNCVFDVMVTGNPGFAATYLLSQALPATSSTTPSPNKLAAFLDLGAGIPNGTFSNAFKTGISFNAGLEYLITPYVSAEGIFGYHRFPGTIAGHANLYQFSANAKVYLIPAPNKFRPFVNGGIGAYKFGSGSSHFGANVGGGVLYELTPRFGLQGSYNFHNVNTPVSATRFSTLQGGVRFVF
ncbi:MAG: lysyl endopeptidase [Blastocatellia bacterium]|nr:lysyl endopeptidase [Blastocatellia bacterium]